MKSDLDMAPILPAFAGFVPDSFLEIYPNDTEHMKLSEWAGFNCSYACILWIEPTNPLFNLFQGKFSVRDTIHKKYQFNPHVGGLFRLIDYIFFLTIISLYNLFSKADFPYSQTIHFFNR